MNRTQELSVRKEDLMTFQIMEEHIKINNKFEPCIQCIRLGLQRGFSEGRQDSEKEFIEWLNQILEETSVSIEKDKELNAIGFNVWILGKVEDKIKALQKRQEET